jgi:hypothetical protein
MAGQQPSHGGCAAGHEDLPVHSLSFIRCKASISPGTTVVFFQVGFFRGLEMTNISMSLTS